jgi:hypothetical protein
MTLMKVYLHFESSDVSHTQIRKIPDTDTTTITELQKAFIAHLNDRFHIGLESVHFRLTSGKRDIPGGIAFKVLRDGQDLFLEQGALLNLLYRSSVLLSGRCVRLHLPTLNALDR